MWIKIKVFCCLHVQTFSAQQSELETTESCDECPESL